MDFPDFAKLARLTEEQLAAVKEWCAGDPANLPDLEASDLFDAPPKGLGVPRALARAAIRAARGTEAGTPNAEPALPPVVKVSIEAPSRRPEEMTTNELIDMMEADEDRLAELAPHYFRTCYRGLVEGAEADTIDWALTREMENADGNEAAVSTWRGRRIIRSLADLTGRKPPLRDPYFPRETLLPDGANPGRAHTYAPLDLDEAIPMLHYARQEGLLSKVDEHEAIHRLAAKGHPWAEAIRRAWAMLPESQRLQWADVARGQGETASTAPPPLGPMLAQAAPVPPGGERRALRKFLTGAFSVGQLRRLVRHEGALGRMAEEIHWEQAPAGVAHDVVALAVAYGAVPHLLAAARRERPGRAAEVDALMVAFGFQRTAPTRKEVHDALWGLSPSDWQTFVDVYLPEAARRVIAGVGGRGKRIGILVEHYDVPHRGLGQLLVLIP